MALSIWLNDGYEALVDEPDYEWLAKFSWVPNLAHTGAVYAIAAFPNRLSPGKQTTREMQRLILDPEWSLPRHVLVDHLNGNTLDNRRDNLRLVGYRKSNLNRRICRRNKTGYRWVIQRASGRYQVMVRTTADGLKYHSAGHFDCPHDAAEAANELALRLFGADAPLNIIDRSRSGV